MIVLSYILTAVGGMLLGAFLLRALRSTSPEPEARKSPYKGIPAADAYKRYAAKVEGENPFFESFRRAYRDREGS